MVLGDSAEREGDNGPRYSERQRLGPEQSGVHELH